MSTKEKSMTFTITEDLKDASNVLLELSSPNGLKNELKRITNIPEGSPISAYEHTVEGFIRVISAEGKNSFLKINTKKENKWKTLISNFTKKCTKSPV